PEAEGHQRPDSSKRVWRCEDVSPDETRYREPAKDDRPWAGLKTVTIPGARPCPGLAPGVRRGVDAFAPHWRSAFSTGRGEGDVTDVRKSCIVGLTHLPIMRTQSRVRDGSDCASPRPGRGRPAGTRGAGPRRGSDPASIRPPSPGSDWA